MADDLSTKTVAQLTQLCESLGKKPPSHLRKHEIIQFYLGLEKMKRENIAPTEKYTGDDLDYTPVYMELKEGETWLQHLHRKGWATVPVLSDPINSAKGFLSWLEELCPQFKRDDPTTWNNKNLPPNLHGIFKHFIGHAEFIWKIREECYPIFSQIWGTPDLLTSFDGGCFLPKSRFKKVQWIHNDHPRQYKGAGFTCVQGLVNLLDNGPEDGGLLLMEGSHLIFDDYIDRHPIDGLGFTHADMKDPQLTQCRPIKICGKAGEIFLWDGRVFHCNVSPVKDNHLRMCVYVSMQPKISATEDEIKRRISYYEKGRMTSHWCYGPYFGETGKSPRTYGKEIVQPPEVEIAPLNDLRKKLIGYS